MANRRPYADVAADEALESRIATRALIETIDRAICDGVIDDDETEMLNRLTARALSESGEAHRASEVAANAARVAHRVMCGPIDSDYLRAETRDAGYDPATLNALIENETAAG